MLRQRDIFIVFGMMVATLLAGCKPRAATKDLILLEARLERTHSGKTEIVSKVRFIAESGCSAAVFLPCGDGLGIGIAFVPEISTKDKIVLSRANFTEKFFAEDILGDYEDWGEKYVHQSGGPGTSFHINKGEGIVFAQGGMSKAGNEVSYKVFVNFNRTVEFSDLRHLGASLVELNGERLHRINVAIPEIMSAGVELGTMNLKTSSN